MKLRDKVALVTGASDGIGRAHARRLAKEGAQVILAARRLDVLEAEAAALRASGLRALALQLDVTSDDSVFACMVEIENRFGVLDILVNNAGNAGTLDFWLKHDAGDLRRMMEVHVFGMERVTRAALPAMLARGSGVIVNTASAVAWVPMPTAAAYSAAKAAVAAFTTALRAELHGKGVKVMLFTPAHTRTSSAWDLGSLPTVSAETCAAKLVTALKHDREEAIGGMTSGNLLTLARIAPKSARAIMRDMGLRAAEAAGLQRP